VKSIKTFVFVLITLFIMSLNVYAADESSTDETEMTGIQTEKPDENHGIVSQSSSIEGYHPLTVAGQEIEATYIEESLGERHGAIIFLHDRAEELEDQGVVTPLRHQMPQYGWSTMTVALDYPYEPAILLSATVENVSEARSAEPAVEEKLGDDDKQEKAPLPPISNVQRLEAAIAFLQAKDIDRIIYVGHGAGGNLAVELLDTETTPIQALVLISTPALTTNDVFNTFQHPILDLYGANDLDGVTEAVHQRKVLMKRTGNAQYSTREISGANHFFTGLETTLVNSLRGWLRSTFLDDKKSN
jgi:hypothetical protein